MALVDCPECNWQFSQYAKICPKCGFPNPLSNYPVSHKKALIEQHPTDIQVHEDIPKPHQVDVHTANVPPAHQHQSHEEAPSLHIKTVRSGQSSHPPEEPSFDNSIGGFFHGRSHFWFALCIDYLGVLAVIAVATVALGEPKFMTYIFGGYAFVGLFVLLWNTKNLSHDVAKWSARILITLLLLVWIGAIQK